ncbi:MAG: EF-hand domain-containing protein [Sphingomonas sp.]
MWRYVAGGVAALLLAASAGMVLFNARAKPEALLAAQPAAEAQVADNAPLPDAAPEASDKTREQKRFDRYDKDRDGKVTREEYLAARRKAFAKLDANHDGMLSFDEWAIKAETKFAAADTDKSGTMTPVEFAATKVQRKAHVRKPCPAGAAPPSQSEES